MRKAQIKKLDSLWSKKVRSVGWCEWCGKSEHLNAHHVIGRRNRNVRWYVPNGVCLCSGCHTFKTTSAHQNYEMFREFIIKERGADWLADLMEKSRIDCMAEKQDYDEELEKLRR